ncbi:MAG TPA: hypothetical protein VEZ72_13035 [Paenibacillus sp.]|nr:hypothetical protein [Paenibacillus sp.]
MTNRKRLEELQKRALELTMTERELLRLVRNNRDDLHRTRILLNERIAFLKCLSEQLPAPGKKSSE